MSEQKFPKRFSDADKRLWLSIKECDHIAAGKAVMDGADVEAMDLSGSRPLIQFGGSAHSKKEIEAAKILDMLLAAGANPHIEHVEPKPHLEEACCGFEHDCDACPHYSDTQAGEDFCDDIIMSESIYEADFDGSMLDIVLEKWIRKHRKDPGLLSKLRDEHAAVVERLGMTEDPEIKPGNEKAGEARAGGKKLGKTTV